MWRVLLACLLSLPAAAQLLPGPSRLGDVQPGPLFGGANEQHSAGIASLSDGRLLVVWLDFGANVALGRLRGAVLDRPSLTPTFLTFDQPELRAEEPDLACGVSSCFVVWLGRSLEDGHVIRGQRLDALGQPTGTSVMLNVPTSLGRSQPAVAMGPNDEVAVVWSEAGVTTVALLGPTGATVRSRFAVGGSSLLQLRPAVGWTEAGLFVTDLLEGSSYELSLSILSEDGGVRAPRVTAAQNTMGMFDARLNVEGADIVITSVRRFGTSFGVLSVIPIVNLAPGAERTFTSNGSYGRPSAVKVGGRWVFAVSDELGGSRAIRVGTFDPDAGTVVDLGQIPGSPPANYSPVLAPTTLAKVRSTGELWLTTTAGTVEVEPDVVVQQLSLGPPALNPPGGARFLRTSAPQVSPTAAIRPDTMLAAWVEQIEPARSRVVVRRFDSRGVSLSAPTPISIAMSGIHGLRDLELVATNDGFAAGWIIQTDRETIHLLQLGATGLATGPEESIFGAGYSEPSPPALISVNGRPWALYGTSQGGGLWLSEGIGDGGWASPRNVIPSTSVFDSVAVASNRTNLFVAWTYAGSVFGSRMNFDGGATNDQLQGELFGYLAEHVSVASDGTDYLVAWADRVTAGTRIEGLLVSGATGRPMSAVTTYVQPSETGWSWGGAAPRPRASFNGTDYELTFDLVTLDGGSGVLARTVGRTGQARGTRVLADGPGHQFDGRLVTDGKGRTVATWTVGTPEPSTQVWGSLTLSLGGGEVCVTSSDCRSNDCRASRCCEVDGGCPGVVDAGVIDAGVDGGAGTSLDGGSPDGGPFQDGGALDGGTDDGGSLDAGPMQDGGTPFDGGAVEDAGVSLDAGVSDAGVNDAGVNDAGVGVNDAGVNAARRLGVGCLIGEWSLDWLALAFLLSVRRAARASRSRLPRSFPEP